MTTRITKRSAGEPTWLDLATPNLEGAKAFYQQLFGWEYVDTGADFGHYNMAMSQGRNAAGIGPIWPPDSPQPSAWTIYFATDDAGADVARVKALGGQVLVEPMVIADSGSMAVCVDPTGAVFGLWEANQHIGAAVEDEHGSMTWRGVNTRNATAAADFYSKLLKLTAVKLEGMDYYILQRDGRRLANIQQMDADWEGIPPHWNGYFAVNDADSAVAHTVAAGGQVRVPAFDIPDGRMAILIDPYGATFSIVELKSA